MISLAKIEEIDELMRFIDEKWRKNHILARNRSFFEYMYVMEDKVNFVISRDSCSNEINGILGFIPYDEGRKQMSLSVWKALSSADGMIGIAMLHFLLKEIDPKVIATPGINPKTTIPIYKFFKFQTGKMKHFYRLSQCESFNIAIVNKIERNQRTIEGTATKINSFDEYKEFNVRFAENALKKEDWYIKKRYFEHPVYRYQAVAIVEDNDALVIFTREQQVNNSKCLRIVDMMGNYELLPKATAYFDNEMKQNHYEYVDCYVTGISEEIFRLAGWENREHTDIVIPNYFAPFEKSNIDLYFSSKPEGIVMLRGDSDQDRPN